MNDRLRRLERQLESLVENALTRMLGADMSAAVVAADLARSMEDNLRTDDLGNEFAPDSYSISLEAERARRLVENAPDIRRDLARGILQAARESGFLLDHEPTITIVADPSLEMQGVRIHAWHSEGPLESTQAMTADVLPLEPSIPPGAFLIVDGKRHFALDQAVLNVGRRSDNHLVIEDPRASRLHAQIREREGRFVIFDLGSTGGTKVNGRPIRQHILQPGDVIAIGGVRIVYGEDSESSPDSTSTFVYPPAADAGPSAASSEDGDPGEMFK
jgi:FHA domain/FhaA, N-terminal domain